jgi:hypothetical protein
MEASDPAETYVIDTASGARLDLDSPRPEDIRVGDMADGRLFSRFLAVLSGPQ